ncbi:MAG: hypothetical protein H6613_06580 [Ignavibacteriales bacterium]|nr:hypothetical protein [Ignavibacteriales bacterium]
MKNTNARTQFDHSITIVMIIFTIILFSAFQLSAQEVEKDDKSDEKTKIVLEPASTQAVTNEIKFKNETGNAIITITDEGDNKGSITLPEMTTAFTSEKTDKIYNLNGRLYWGELDLTTSGGASQLNDLTDAKYEGSSLFLGEGSGAMDDGTNNYNTAVGNNALHLNTLETKIRRMDM